MEKLVLLSNGFFSKNVYKGRKNNIEIDYNEEAMFNEFYNNDSFNVMVDKYNFDINDLAELKAENGENILKDFYIDKEDYEFLAENHYIEYSRTDDILKVTITIYDFEDCMNKDLLAFLEKFGRTIEIIVNTQEERDIIFKKLDDYFRNYGYENMQDFLEIEYDEYIKESEVE